MLLCFMKKYSNIYSLSSDHLHVLDSSFMCAWSTCMEPSYWWHWLRNIGELFLGLQPIVGFVCNRFSAQKLKQKPRKWCKKCKDNQGYGKTLKSETREKVWIFQPDENWKGGWQKSVKLQVIQRGWAAIWLFTISCSTESRSQLGGEGSSSCKR